MGPDCFPPWLKRRTLNTYGPQLEDVVPYPVYQVQQPHIASNNPNVSSPVITNSLHQHYEGAFVPGSGTNGTKSTIVHVMPNNLYDNVVVVAFDVNTTPGSNVVPPIFLSFMPPGRILTETQVSQEVLIAAANSLASTLNATTLAVDPSSIPQFIEMGEPQGAHNYSMMQLDLPLTNCPFWVWFADGFGTDVSTGCNFRISWFTKGR